LYDSLDQKSVTKHLALYELYPDTPIGQQALQDALGLLCGNTSIDALQQIPDFKLIIDGIINLVNKPANENCPLLSEEVLNCIEDLAKRLPHKNLKGSRVWSEEEVLALPAEEIDLARGLLLSDIGNTPEARQKIGSYEAMLDLMALQIMARLPSKAVAEEKIRALNDFIFFEMGFRFPPHSQSVKDIDLYSFLPSVMDSRKGVCLGVSILYICLAQRLDIPLEIITPPGHIFVRYHKKNKTINIETTARGIHLDDEVYLNIDTRSLQTRSMKETIGMAHFNQAAVYWQLQDHERALRSYLKAAPYLPGDKLLQELMGYAYLVQGDMEKGMELMKHVKDHVPEYAVSQRNVALDILEGNANGEGILAILMFVDENRASLLNKKEALEKVLHQYPRFRAGLFSLAGTWLQLHRYGEALSVLERYHEIDDTDPSVEYYLAELYALRMNYNKAWEHLKQAEFLVAQRDHAPLALKKFRQQLCAISPE
jgi:regulator of sirC expression with transglutaminase-like and TPR domain